MDSIRMPTRVVRDYLNDSRPWDNFLAEGGFVEDDIVVVDPFKAGTTWTQNIITQILINGNDDVITSLSKDSPWIDSSWGDHTAMLALLKRQREEGKRRLMKSHVHADAVPIDPRARYVFVGRNGKDLALSFHKYLFNFTPEVMAVINRLHAAYQGPSSSPLVIPQNAEDFINPWLDTNGAGCCDLFGITKTWFDLRDQPNVLLVHYNNSLRDLPSAVARIAKFIGVDPTTLDMDKIVHNCSFDAMKGKASKYVPFNGSHMVSAESFFDKGPNRNFRTEISPELIKKFDSIALLQMGEDCAKWLETGL